MFIGTTLCSDFGFNTRTGTMSGASSSIRETMVPTPITKNKIGRRKLTCLRLDKATLIASILFRIRMVPAVRAMSLSSSDSGWSVMSEH